MEIGATTLENRIRLAVGQWGRDRTEAQALLDQIVSPEIEQLVLLARTDPIAQDALRFKYDLYLEGIVSDVCRLKPPDGDIRPAAARLREFAAQVRREDRLAAGIDDVVVKDEATRILLELAARFEPKDSQRFTPYLFRYLPKRMHTWLRLTLFRIEKGRLRPRSQELSPTGSIEDLMRAIEERPEHLELTPLEELLASSAIRRYLVATLLDALVLPGMPEKLPPFNHLAYAVLAHGFQGFDPVLVPRRAALLGEGGTLDQASRHYRPPHPSRLPLYIPDDERLDDYFCSRDIGRTLASYQEQEPNRKAWEVLRSLFGEGVGRVRQADLAAQLSVTQQRISLLRRVGMRLYLRRELDRHLARMRPMGKKRRNGRKNPL